MRRTTQWAVFTSMNKQQARRSLYEPSESVPLAQSPVTEAGHPEQRPGDSREPSDTALDLRRDRVDFM